MSPAATALALPTLAIIVVVHRAGRACRDRFVALVVGDDRARGARPPVETIGTRFGGIPAGLPHVAIPAFHPALVPGLLVPAMTVAMLGAIESLMSAVVADK